MKSDPIEIRDAIRKRPGMYIGDPDHMGLYAWAEELILSTTVELDQIEVRLSKDATISVYHKGDTGIGIDRFKAVFTESEHLNADFPLRVGPTVTFCLSDRFEAVLRSSGQQRTLVGRDGTLASDTTEPTSQPDGLRVRARPDRTIYQSVRVFDPHFLFGILRAQALVTPGLSVSLRDGNFSPTLKLAACYPGGLGDFLKENAPLGTNHWFYPTIIEFAGSEGEFKLKGALFLDWNLSDRSLVSIVNHSPVSQGEHVRGFWKGVSQAFETLIWDKPNKAPFGVSAAFVLDVGFPRFAAPVKENLVNEGVADFVSGIVSTCLTEHLAHPDYDYLRIRSDEEE